MKVSGLSGKIGIAIAGSACALAAADRLTGNALSSAAARAICGAAYLSSVGGVVGDASCGFNADMHFMLVMAIAAVVGVVVALARAR